MLQGVNFVSDKSSKKSDNDKLVIPEFFGSSEKQNSVKAPLSRPEVKKTEEKVKEKIEEKVKVVDQLKNKLEQKSWWTNFWHKDKENKIKNKKEIKEVGVKVKLEEKKQDTKDEFTQNNILIERGFDINLIPQTDKGLGLGSKVAILVTILIVIMVGLFGAKWAIKTRNDKIIMESDELTKQTNELNEKITGLTKDAEQASRWYKKVAVARRLISQHKWWSKLFLGLEKETPKGVYYNSMNVGLNGITFDAVAENYEALSKAVLAYQNSELMSDFKIMSIGKIEKGEEESENKNISFDLFINLKPEFLVGE